MGQPIGRVCKKALTLACKTQLSKNFKTLYLIYEESFIEMKIYCFQH